jgi:hypothetical protein
MADFKFRDTLESWVEGIFDTIERYLRTLYFLNINFLRWFQANINGEVEKLNIVSSGMFFVISYFLMLYLIQNIDFTNPVFSFNLTQVTNAMGVLEASKKLSVESIIMGIIPGLVLLFLFVYVTIFLSYVFKETIDQKKLRDKYAYAIGSFFIVLGAMCYSFQHFVLPARALSWWLGLFVYAISMIPLIGVMSSYCGIIIKEIFISSRRNASKSIAFGWLISSVILMVLMKVYFGSYYFMDYFRIP